LEREAIERDHAVGIALGDVRERGYDFGRLRRGGWAGCGGFYKLHHCAHGLAPCDYKTKCALDGGGISVWVVSKVR
jgi:hypothetical protein